MNRTSALPDGTRLSERVARLLERVGISAAEHAEPMPSRGLDLFGPKDHAPEQGPVTAHPARLTEPREIALQARIDAGLESYTCRHDSPVCCARASQFAIRNGRRPFRTLTSRAAHLRSASLPRLPRRLRWHRDRSRFGPGAWSRRGDRSSGPRVLHRRFQPTAAFPRRRRRLAPLALLAVRRRVEPLPSCRRNLSRGDPLPRVTRASRLRGDRRVLHGAQPGWGTVPRRLAGGGGRLRGPFHARVPVRPLRRRHVRERALGGGLPLSDAGPLTGESRLAYPVRAACGAVTRPCTIAPDGARPLSRRPRALLQRDEAPASAADSNLDTDVLRPPENELTDLRRSDQRRELEPRPLRAREPGAARHAPRRAGPR
jgi:hypothetical protein